MSGAYKVDIKGLEELKKSLGRKKMSIEQIDKAVSKATDAAYDHAREVVPKETNHLHDSIVKSVEGTTGKVEATARYARYVEFGTLKHGPEQPFMRPAQKVGREKLIEEALKLVKEH